MLEDLAGQRRWTRVALTADQARDLPTITKHDKRYRPPREVESVEVEALGQIEVTDLVRKALEKLLPTSMEKVKEVEERQREDERELLENAP